LPFLSVDAAVGQDQLKRIPEETDGVFAGNSFALALREEILMFANREKRFDGIHLRDGSQNRSGPDQVAHLDLSDSRDAIYQRR